MIPAVEVYVDQNNAPVLAGVARFALKRGQVSTTFSYADSYLERTDCFALEPLMPLAQRTHHFLELPGCFRDSSPDRWGRHLVAKRNSELAPQNNMAPNHLDEVDFLTGVFDATRQGALRFRNLETSEWLSRSQGVPPLVKLPRLLAASRAVALDAEGKEQIKELLDAGSGSLGGARPKATVVDESKVLLAKFSHPSDQWNVMAWEATALDLATTCGIEAPAHRLAHIGTEDVLLLERFDREGSLLNGGRICYMSAMTLLGASDGQTKDYLEYAEALTSIAGHKEVAEQLLLRIAFSIAIHNTDDHLRNHGLLRKDRNWTLAPLFDVNPNPCLKQPRVTAIFGETSAGEVTGLKQLAKAIGASDAQLTAVTAKVCEALAGWQTAACKNGCKEAEQRIFAPVFKDRLAALEALTV